MILPTINDLVVFLGVGIHVSTNGLACWFGAFSGLGFGSWVHPRIPIPFIFGDARIPNHRAPNQKNNITWAVLSDEQMSNG